MLTPQRSSNVAVWAIASLFLLALGVVVMAALAGGAYRVPAGVGSGLVCLGLAWSGLRVRARQRLHAILDTFADQELARQR
jgi:hypothetical protein